MKIYQLKPLDKTKRVFYKMIGTPDTYGHLLLRINVMLYHNSYYSTLGFRIL